MPSGDPVRTFRYQSEQALLKLLRKTRSGLLRELQGELRKTPVDAEALEGILNRVFGVYIEPKAARILEHFIRSTYESSVSFNLSRLAAAQKPREIKDIQFSLHFDRADHDAIKNLQALARVELKGLTADTTKEIVRNLVDLDTQGVGVTKMAEKVIEDYQLPMHRAVAISRTSVNQAYNEAAWSRIERYAPFKVWIPVVSDDRTRPSHRLMKGVIIPVDELFEVPAFKPSPGSKKEVPAALMRFPGDRSQNPDPAQIINCRCTLGGRFSTTPSKVKPPRKK